MHAGHKDITLCGSLLEPLAILGNSLNWWINVWSLSNRHQPSKVKCALHCQMWQMSLYIFPFSSFPSLASKAQTSEQLITATGKNSVQLPSQEQKKSCVSLTIISKLPELLQGSKPPSGFRAFTPSVKWLSGNEFRFCYLNSLPSCCSVDSRASRETRIWMSNLPTAIPAILISLLPQSGLALTYFDSSVSCLFLQLHEPALKSEFTWEML